MSVTTGLPLKETMTAAIRIVQVHVDIGDPAPLLEHCLTDIDV